MAVPPDDSTATQLPAQTSGPGAEVDPPPGASLVDRDLVLQDLSRYLADAWASFDEPRPAEPEADKALLARLDEPLPDKPDDPQQTLADAVSILEASVSPARPLYLAYVGSTGLETGVLASALATAYDANLAVAAGAADLLDQQALRWVAEFLGYPVVEGHFTSGGQVSNLTAILAAREVALPGSREHGMTGQRAAVYCSDEAHQSVARAVEAAGLGSQGVRRIPTDGRRRMRPDALAEAIAADRAAGITPVAVVATAGTTLTGAVDPLDEIADVCEREDLWLHVDGAYGLPAAASSSAGHLFAGLARADSATVDAHKWFGMQKSCSAILVRRPGALHAAFGHEERYMLHEEDTAIPVDSTFEYSRPFRSLLFWLSMRVYGAEQFRTWIDGTLANAALLADTIRANAEFELLHDPMLSTICFRHTPAGLDADALDEHNGRLAREMQRDGRIFLAPASIDGHTCLRVCFVNFRTTPDAVPVVLEVAAELGNALVDG